MPKVSVYLPDDSYRQARDRSLPISTLTQQAVEEALRRASHQDWVLRMQAVEPRLTRAVDVPSVVESVREEFGA